jgi:hypothetical protein
MATRSRPGLTTSRLAEVDLLERTQVPVAPFPRSRGEVGREPVGRRADAVLAEAEVGVVTAVMDPMTRAAL